MRVLYLECGAGASGDMLLGALSEIVGTEESERILSSMGVPETEFVLRKDERSGVRGTRAEVLVRGREEHEHNHKNHHSHRSMAEISRIIMGLDIPECAKKRAADVYGRIARAEGEAHGLPPSEVHFHEVGMLDAVADVTGTCALIEAIAPDAVVASPLRTGYGYVECAHGTLPVPAPATASLLKGIPSFAGDEEGEFTTPTGAALVGALADEYGSRPMMTVERIGCGLGGRRTRIPNVLRAFVGEASRSMPSVRVLTCSIDDMTPEDLSTAMSRIMADGALDAYVVPATMKKGRPGHVLTCICRESDSDRVASSVLRNTSTIGVRVCGEDRYEMSSRIES